jgi:hypothetical protein
VITAYRFRLAFFAGLSFRLLWRFQPGDPSLHVGALLNKLGEFLPAVLAGHAEFFGSVQLDGQRVVTRFLHLVELDPVTVTSRGNDLPGA